MTDDAERDILSTRLENRAKLLTMIAQGEYRPLKACFCEMIREMAANMHADARAAGRLERDRGRSV